MSFHPILLRQLKETQLSIENFSEKEKQLLDTVSRFYYKQSQESERFSLAIDTLTNENDTLIKNLKEKSKQAIAESKMAILGEMSAGIAHEINNPLMVLQNILDLIETGGLSSTDLEEQIREANKTITRIEKIVKGLKTFSRNGSNDPYLIHNLNDIVLDTVALCSDFLKKNQIQVSIDICKEIQIACHPSEISQVFLNLISNAKDAILESNEKWIKINSCYIDDKVLIKVMDSGKGIPLAIQEKIMNPFFTTKDIGKGTGLGLSISKGFIESHQGLIKINNESENTCFDIYLPKNS